MNLDGSNQQKIDNFPNGKFSPDDNNGFYPSPDGKQIAFLFDNDEVGGIRVINIESGVLSNLAKDQGYVDSFAWSPDGEEIAFVAERDTILLDANRGLSTNNIYVMNADGSDVSRLTTDNTTKQYGLLSWSPDGKKLAFGMSNGFFSIGIQIMNLSDAKLTALTNPSGLAQDDPSWSPDGKHIIYQVGTESNNLYVMNANGTNQVTLSNDPLGIVLSASWSPDGNHIVFSTVKFQVQDDNRKYYIYTMNADGTNLVALSKDPSPYDTSPSWSPDGKYIVFASKRDGGKSHLYIMNADGTNQRQLTNGSGEEAAPIWLPAP
jgi:Tol biopolymer transport system component